MGTAGAVPREGGAPLFFRALADRVGSADETELVTALWDLVWAGLVTNDTVAGHRPGRRAGALAVLVDGELVLYVERGGKSLLSWIEDTDVPQPAVAALASAVREGSLGKLAVERADGSAVSGSLLGAALERAGFHPTPRGLRLRA